MLKCTTKHNQLLLKLKQACTWKTIPNDPVPTTRSAM